MPVTKLTPIKNQQKIKDRSTNLIPYSNIGATTLIGLNNSVRKETQFLRHIISQLVGHLLGMVQFIFVKHPSHHILYLLKHKKDFNIYDLFSNSYRIIVVDNLCLISLFEMVILTKFFECSDSKLSKIVNTFPFILYNKKR